MNVLKEGVKLREIWTLRFPHRDSYRLGEGGVVKMTVTMETVQGAEVPWVRVEYTTPGFVELVNLAHVASVVLGDEA